MRPSHSSTEPLWHASAVPPLAQPIQFHPNIKFSHEHTGDTPSILFLDTSGMFMEDRTIAMELYIKPTHSGVLLHQSSAHPRSTKDTVASSQMNRALQVSSMTAGSSRSTEKIATMLEKNDYPTDMIVKSKKRATQRSSGQHQWKERTAKIGVLSLPYISEEVTHRVRKAVKKSGLNIHIAQRSGPTMKSILTWSALEPPECPSQRRCVVCQAGLKARYTTKNIIYRLNCTLCTKSYIGETKRPIRERFLESLEKPLR